ncbi:glycosyltransferase family 2 protein [Flavobacteriaceae bacterium]|nr:glycosyltransferase family 2 protein [Flavobacteriaceae bacterium]
MINNKISIIIPCRNEVRYIENLLNSISKNEYPNELIEVIVVDGMSDDGTRELLLNIINKKKYCNIKVIDNIRKKTPYAFNLGVKESSGEFVIIAGARFILSKNYFSEAIKVLASDSKTGCVGGMIINLYENKTSEIISAAMSSPFGIGFNNFRTINKDAYVDTVTPPFFRKSIFTEIGYFDERLTRNQDDDFSYRLIKSGYKIFLKANISIKYNVRTSFNGLYIQYKQYGYWKVFVNRKHKTFTTLRQLFPMFFILSFFLLTLLSFLFSTFIYFLVFELVLYTMLNLFFALKDNGLNLMNGFKQMYTCLILHISYGLGYIEGIYDFVLLKKLPNEKNEKLSR